MNYDKKDINKKIASSIFNLLVTIDDQGNYKVMTTDKKFVDVPDYLGDLDEAFNVVNFFKKKGYFVSIGYIEKNNQIYWNTKITKNKSIYDSNLRNTIQESICYATLAFLAKKAQKKEAADLKPINNIVSIDFKK